MSLTISMVSARPDPRYEWFFDSLRHNSYIEEISQIIICDLYAEEFEGWSADDAKRAVVRICEAAGVFAGITQVIPPKPCVWSGRYRLTPRNWWSKSSFLNSCLCHARSDYLAFVDDRCVLAPTWMDAVVEAREKQYVVAGTYEKRSGMVVRDGRIIHEGKLTATDCRMDEPAAKANPHRRRPIRGDDLFGCTFGLPTEWMLRVNGFSELWDSCSFEDVHFGVMLQNNGFPIYHDGRMKMIEDRTPVEQDPSCREHDMKRSSKEKHPNDTSDKIWTLKRRLFGEKSASHHWNMREIQESVLRGNAFPIPRGPEKDWFDQMPLKDMT